MREQSVLAAAALARKTTLLRDVARFMSSPHCKGGLGMSVVVVDTSNEIAGWLIVKAEALWLCCAQRCPSAVQSLLLCCSGAERTASVLTLRLLATCDCEQPHPCIGNARRMMVPFRHQQAAVMMEAVCNHSPEVIVVDEVATKEVRARGAPSVYIHTVQATVFQITNDPLPEVRM